MYIIPQETSQSACCIREGDLAYFMSDVMQLVDFHCLIHCIGRDGPVLWPPRSPDPTPANCYIGDGLEVMIYSKRVEHVAEFLRLTEAAAITLRHMTEMF